MKLAINAKAAFAPQRTGLEEYAFQLVRQWLLNPSPHQLNLYTDRWPAGGELLADYFGAPVPPTVHFGLLRARRLWTQGRLSIELLKNRPDVFFNPVQLLPLYSPRRSVITVHDLGYEHFPEAHSQFRLRYLRATTRSAARRAAAIIAVSQNTKHDLVNLYGVAGPKITVVPHGFTPPDRARAARGLDRFERRARAKFLPFTPKAPYVLYLGRLELRKNILNLIRAFETAKLRYQLPHHLVLAGSPGFGYGQISAAIISSPVEAFIHETGHVSGPAKLQLLSAAEALLLVSYYEGFGLPILEAQALGVPVMAANTSSLPEVGGRGALFVSPADIEAMSDRLNKLVTFPQFRAHYIQHGFENVRRFSWRETARRTLAVLNEVAQGRVYFET